MKKREITIAGRKIGDGHRPYIVAELSANHNGDLGRAREIMEAAARAGADAIKLQTYTPDSMTIDHDGPGFALEAGLWKGRRLYELYGEAMTPYEWHPELFAIGRRLGITVFSTPFDPAAVDLLESLGAPAYKVASFELVDIPLIERIAHTGKPTIMSTGLASVAEMMEAVDAFHAAGGRELVVLHCISAYPAPPEAMNLRTIPHMRDLLGVPIGLSDHTIDIEVSVAATALGATLIEKHVTLRRADGGPDSAFSLEPHELERLVVATRNAHMALGRIDYAVSESEAPQRDLRRSLYVVENIRAGEALTTRNVRAIRPGYGLAPRHAANVLGRKARRDLARGTPLSFDLID